MRLDPANGSTIWSDRYDFAGASDEVGTRGMFIRGSKLGCFDDVYITGGSQQASGNYDYATIKYRFSVAPCRLSEEEEENADETLSVPAFVYPNPFSDYAFLSVRPYLQLQSATLDIYDLLGNNIRRINN